MLPNCETVPKKTIKSIQILPNCETVPKKPKKPILQSLGPSVEPQLQTQLPDSGGLVFWCFWYSFTVWQYLDWFYLFFCTVSQFGNIQTDLIAFMCYFQHFATYSIIYPICILMQQAGGWDSPLWLPRAYRKK